MKLIFRWHHLKKESYSLVTLFFISLLLSIIENSAFTTDGTMVLSVENREANRGKHSVNHVVNFVN